MKLPWADVLLRFPSTSGVVIHDKKKLIGLKNFKAISLLTVDEAIESIEKLNLIFFHLYGFSRPLSVAVGII